MFLAEIDLKKRTSLLEYNFENNYCGDDKITTEAGNHICDIIHIQQFFSESLLLNINILSILEATPPSRRTGRRTISCLADVVLYQFSLPTFIKLPATLQV